MKRKQLLILCGLFLIGLSGCAKKNPPEPFLTPSAGMESAAPEPIATATPIPEKETAQPTASPTPTVRPSYQPILVTHEPISEQPENSSSEIAVNHPPVFDFSKWESLSIHLKESGVAGSDPRYGSSDTIVNGTMSFSRQLAGSDPDGDSVAYYLSAATGSNAVRSLETTYASITLDVLGNLNYQLKDSISALSQNENAIDFFMVRITDSSGAYSEAQITVNIEGTNSAPTLSSGSHRLSVPGSGEKQIQGQLTISDPDHDASLGLWKIEGYAYSEENGVLSIGSSGWNFILEPSGKYTFTAAAGCSTGVLTIPVLYQDNHASSASCTITFDLTANKTPVIHVPETFTLTYDGSKKVYAEGSIQVSDEDGDSIIYSLLSNAEGSGGILSLNDDGSFRYIVYEDLHSSCSDSFSVLISDGLHQETVSLNFQVQVAEIIQPGSESSDTLPEEELNNPLEQSE